MRHGLLLSAAVMIAGFLAVGCSERHEEFSAFGRVDSRGWAYGDTVSVMPVDLDSVRAKRLEIAVRHTNDYPYRNLWLELSYSVGRLTVRDTVQLLLADVYGRWQGQGFGPSYQMSRRLRSRFVIPDSTVISLRHIMRVDTLPGIEQVGITVASE